MVLPIYLYGSAILRQQARDVERNSEELQRFIDDMIETMHGASGIGLAAPQVGRDLRLFVIDLSALVNDVEDPMPVSPDVPAELFEGPYVFINPEIVEESPDTSTFEEGCLSIPGIREEISRPAAVSLRYRNRAFEPCEISVDETLARVIQHEYDHLEGVLFLDKLSAFRRRLLRRKLRDMSEGKADAEYPIMLQSPAR